MCNKIFILFVLTGLIESFIFPDELTISGSPGVLTINTATAGSQPNNAINTSTSYGVLTTILTTKITGSLNANMPANVTLAVSLAAPLGATSAGFVNMTTGAQDLVTGINILTIASGLLITYRLGATVQAAQVTNGTRTLTLTLQ